MKLDAITGLRDDELTCDHYDGAIVMHMAGPSADSAAHRAGGCYDSTLSYVPDSSTIRSWGALTGPHDTAQLDARLMEYEDVEGVFCGPLLRHFGHFLLESMARLWWPVSQNFTGRYVFQCEPSTAVPKFAEEAFNILGLSDRVDIIRRPTKYRRLYIPEPAFSIQRYAHRSMRVPFRKMSETVLRSSAGAYADKLYISRLGVVNGHAIGEHHLSDIFESNGFQPYFPEEHGLQDQIAAVASATSVAGLSGSGMHLLLFGEGQDVTYLLRSEKVNANYPMQDQVADLTATYLPAVEMPRSRLGKADFGSSTPVLLLPDIYIPALQLHGFECSSRVKSQDEVDRADFLRSYHANLAKIEMARNRQGAALTSAMLATVLGDRSADLRAILTTSLLAGDLELEAECIRSTSFEATLAHAGLLS